MTKFLLSIALIIVGLAAATLTVMHFARAQVAVQRSVLPGRLSQPHAFLENKCAACHTPTKGVEAKNCDLRAREVHDGERRRCKPNDDERNRE